MPDKESFIPVFIDAKPSETLDPSTKKTLCFVGILSNKMGGVKNLKAYKRTKRLLKVDSAERIVEALNNKEHEVDAIGFGSRTNGQFIHWACDNINRSRERIGAEWKIHNGEPTHLIYKGEKIDRSTALGLAAYTSILPIIALRAEMITHGGPIKKFKLCLDSLPNNSLLGMDLMNQLKDDDEIMEMWRDNMSRGASFEVGIFHKWKNMLGKWHPAKRHPNSILVDWFAASCLANIRPEQLQEEGNYRDNELDKIAAIWHKAVNSDIRDLDDKKLQDRIKAHK